MRENDHTHFQDPGGQGLKQYIRCTSKPQYENNAKRIIILTIIRSEHKCSHDYMWLQVYRRKWPHPFSKTLEVKAQTNYKVHKYPLLCKRNLHSTNYDFWELVFNYIVTMYIGENYHTLANFYDPGGQGLKQNIRCTSW